ncbi:MAG: hypothetical protein ACXVRA_08615 [Gaiellaceae bacterium]
MKKTNVVLCSITSALMLAGSAAAGHKPVPAPDTTVTPDSLSGGRAALVAPVSGGTIATPFSFSSGR